MHLYAQRARAHVGRRDAQHAQDTEQTAPRPSMARGAHTTSRHVDDRLSTRQAEQPVVGSSPDLVPATPIDNHEGAELHDDGATATPMSEEMRDHIQVL